MCAAFELEIAVRAIPEAVRMTSGGVSKAQNLSALVYPSSANTFTFFLNFTSDELIYLRMG